jgi:hypothetical protein
MLDEPICEGVSAVEVGADPLWTEVGAIAELPGRSLALEDAGTLK